MQSIKSKEFKIESSSDWNEISRNIQQGALKVIKLFGANARRSSAKFYICINTDVRYFSQGRLIDTRIRDLHTNLGETLIELKDLKSYVEDYIDMLQEFCEGNNKGAIGSCGTFESVDSFEIIVCKPVGHL